jgi:hypothetical protein
MMTRVLQGPLLVAGVLALTVVMIVAGQIIGAARGEKQRSFPWIMVLEGSRMFSGSVYAMAIGSVTSSPNAGPWSLALCSDWPQPLWPTLGGQPRGQPLRGRKPKGKR